MQDPSLYSQIRSLVQPQPQPQPQPQFPDQEHLKCPRCDSANTKFCYYNNYNLSQPRHYCKNCKRYWTKGGALRNIPVGGGSRKNTKRSSASSSSSANPHSHQNKRPATTAPASNNSKNMDDASVIRELLPLKGDNYAGQFGNLLDGTNGSRLQLRDHFGDPGPGHEMDHRVGMGMGSGSDGTKNGDGFLNGGGGFWLA